MRHSETKKGDERLKNFSDFAPKERKNLFAFVLSCVYILQWCVWTCVHAPERGAMHQKWNKALREGILFMKWESEWSKCLRCQTGVPTKPTSQQRGLGLHSSLIGSLMILIICRHVVPLRLVVARFPSCCLCWVLSMPTCWFSASCWVNGDWLTLHLAHCSLPGSLDWRAFCWQLLALPPGQRRLSWAVDDHLFAPGAEAGHHLSTAAMWH